MSHLPAGKAAVANGAGSEAADAIVATAAAAAAVTNAARVTAPSFDISPARMRTKKLARRAAVRLGQVLRSLRPAAGIRVLTYHRFGHSPLDPCCLAPHHFEEQLDWLQANASLLSPPQFEAIMSGAAPAPRDAVLITIDDGHESVATHALPALDRRGVAAVLFVCPQLVDRDDAALRPPHPRFMGWRALASAKACGHEIAPHGHSHRSLGRLPLAEAVADIDQATAALQARLEVRSRFFAFPFGTRADHSPALAAALARRGFRYCFTSAHGSCLPGSDGLLPRIKIEGGDEQDLFAPIVRGCIDHWRLVDDGLSFLQQRGRM